MLIKDDKTTRKYNMETPVKNLVDIVELTSDDALLPLFECIINSIISLKLLNFKKEDKKIKIQIFRGESPQEINFDDINTISNIIITDNGIGFNEKNFNSFKIPHSQLYKDDFGCKGLGRFTVLAAFNEMNIKSIYFENEIWKYREFKFNNTNEIYDIIENDNPEIKTNKTIVELIKCNNHIILDKTAISIEEIANKIMQHCLIYYLCDDLPIIEIQDFENNELSTQIIVNDLYKEFENERIHNFKVKDIPFKVYVMQTLKASNRKNHYIYYCANSRIVGNPKHLNKIDSIFSYPIVINDNEYFLNCYIVSDFLNKRVHNSRNSFRILQDNEDILECSNDISFKDIENSLSSILEEQFSDFIIKLKEQNVQAAKDYINLKAPRYRSFLKDEKILNDIPYNLSDDKKEEWLYQKSLKVRNKVEEQIQEFIDKKEFNKENIESIIKEVKTKTAYDADSLADYMIRRKSIIDLFDKFLDADAKGEYKLESDIHNLIFPMGLISDEIDYESHNLWLLDERFATYKFIASDKSISSISQKKSSKEPDIIMFDNRFSFGQENSGEISSLVIFEFKRPGEIAHQKNKTNYRWKFSELVEKYFDDFIYSQDKKNYKGRSVKVGKTTPKFGYIVIDVVPSLLETYNENKGWKKTPFGSYFKMNEGENLYIEVLTFAKLIEFARKRHSPFFDKLFVTK